MIYLGEKNIKDIDLNWEQNIKAIEMATRCIESNDIAQPIKPYLRYGDIKNRIIAMPAFVGGKINRSGIKWIASFPDNPQKGIARAHSVIVLNEAETGKPVSIINSGSISAIRTASVSGLMIKKFMELKRHKNVKVGLIGFGPIGQYHLEMCNELLGESLEEVLLYDLKDISKDDINSSIEEKISIVNSWEEAYANADIFITCTVSKEPYIDKKPKDSSLHLNVSLRDYKTDVFPWFEKSMVVDDWNEVCRENTDIEMFHKVNHLEESQVSYMQDVLNGFFETLDDKQPIMFNPMGMAVFDMAIAGHYLNLAKETEEGVLLE
ncbi:2,3-diaminopropionate biosynthesis protein SbnB [Tenacibaculum sp. E3R01]|uniref:2,3-diaminopropionate biosynthesis protein SbnB n=1 Tax=Tenacibaculum sp. E3R01 TaxID=2267227 RepID=UPI000DE8D894|nr:2,3-diaminopropionate biosynthesis protein SbnB [Tenacibaculum sp. E3R01]RBW55180.1 2,3-diaminopropionate biosynthesis protein SbnB [Tenacibaculum sp. E3R01]